MTSRKVLVIIISCVNDPHAMFMMHLYVLLFCYFMQKLDFGRTLQHTCKNAEHSADI